MNNILENKTLEEKVQILLNSDKKFKISYLTEFEYLKELSDMLKKEILLDNLKGAQDTKEVLKNIVNSLEKPYLEFLETQNLLEQNITEIELKDNSINSIIGFEKPEIEQIFNKFKNTKLSFSQEKVLKELHRKYSKKLIFGSLLVNINNEKYKNILLNNKELVNYLIINTDFNIDIESSLPLDIILSNMNLFYNKILDEEQIKYIIHKTNINEKTFDLFLNCENDIIIKYSNIFIQKFEPITKDDTYNLLHKFIIKGKTFKFNKEQVNNFFKKINPSFYQQITLSSIVNNINDIDLTSQTEFLKQVILQSNSIEAFCEFLNKSKIVFEDKILEEIFLKFKDKNSILLDNYLKGKITLSKEHIEYLIRLNPQINEEISKFFIKQEIGKYHKNLLYKNIKIENNLNYLSDLEFNSFIDNLNLKNTINSLIKTLIIEKKYSFEKTNKIFLMKELLKNIGDKKILELIDLDNYLFLINKKDNNILNINFNIDTFINKLNDIDNWQNVLENNCLELIINKLYENNKIKELNSFLEKSFQFNSNKNIFFYKNLLNLDIDIVNKYYIFKSLVNNYRTEKIKENVLPSLQDNDKEILSQMLENKNKNSGFKSFIDKLLFKNQTINYNYLKLKIFENNVPTKNEDFLILNSVLKNIDILKKFDPENKEINTVIKNINNNISDIEKQINYKINLFEAEKTKTIHINQIKREIIQKSLKI